MNTRSSPSREAGRAQFPFLCFLVAILEGFDLQVAGIAAPNLKAQFSLDPVTLGWFFSASTIGLFIGALAGGHLSDRIGRGATLCWSVAAFGAASMLTGLASGPAMLIATRFATGLGLGGALPNLLAITSEAAIKGQERRAVALLYCGVPIGGILVSLLGAARGSDWRTPFLAGGILPIILAVTLWRTAPAADGRADIHSGRDRVDASAIGAMTDPCLH
ncbi:Major Facilitator Superfamily protein [Sphingobium faniae]|nr:Major Facilitator Superfamily protein [Sphingobium faniae]